ncbi:hypothetical protein D3C72_979980 [compost metagenome]
MIINFISQKSEDMYIYYNINITFLSFPAILSSFIIPFENEIVSSFSDQEVDHFLLYHFQ